MNSFNSFLLLLITSAYCIFESVQAQDQSEFISLDCGLVPKDTIYREKSTNIVYKSDANYIESGVARKVNAAYMTLSQRQRKIWSLRSFPEGTRNCYNFNLTAKRRYLIRADFVYGNYDDRNQLPSFDLHVGPNKWTSVSVPGLKNSSYHEMIHVLTQDPLQVCLVKTGETTPFISSLQLRPLHNETYGTKSGSLVTISRVYFSPTTLVVRYADDIHDRGWSSYLDSQMKSISTDLFVNTSNFYDVPQAVARNAAVPANESQPLTINWSLNEITTQIYVYMHFAEIQNLEAKGTREFNIYCNGNEHWLSYFRPPKFTIKTIANSRAISSPDGKFNLTLAMTGNSTLPPLINGLELYKVLSLLQLDTDQDEVSAMVNIKRSYGLEKKVSWQGDPCAPQIYLWEGLNCSYPDSKPPRIISLNLRGNKLTGSITPELSKLTQLIELDLSMNDLSGDIPDFFADMKSLKLIKLSGNPNLNGKIPDSLKKRLKSHSITLILSERKKVPVVAIVFGVSALLVILAIFFVFLRWKRIKRKTRSFSSSITRKDLRIRFPKILEMTNNFERVLGKGGFGTVYHGKLDDTQVAVKMLSSSSAQGYKEFKAEVELLLRVHHRHLVGLVGYCDDGDNLALIYEYMAKGDLHENMSGKHSGNVLSWETRMQIAVEAGQGLEYLHNGCEPPMVHRDVKSTNILLNERYVAKLADFGLSRSFPIDGEGHVSTAVAGTPGYLDPEYYRTNILSAKSDIYSFGIVLLEIITNQPVIDKTRERPNINEWVGFMLTRGDIRSITDPKLMGDYDTNGAWKIVELALACVNPSSNRRPTMAQVVVELTECVALENARRQGSEEMYSRGSVDFNLSSDSEFTPGAR
ncbi:PREDICTED: probable LRR receptor-like serine/threonine-protein kinase At1g51880 isoform X1 [Brassica oleracea var. oleracea]|uniref:probable LRR receptor-like serine/threonine-protein kinase At1g51880 isoform X1 n=2 Tax=Brassica oleracea var. oleracea TaxID=109376 RepID=UPI0006A6D464|nr:PREDICTED: probable LRR receptor-like serine/threonine-protein kinase At1g51880 isoform X1 [Brassica oleracea var. oleracea]